MCAALLGPSVSSDKSLETRLGTSGVALGRPRDPESSPCGLLSRLVAGGKSIVEGGKSLDGAFIYSFIHSFIQIELQACCMSDAMLSTGNTEMNKTQGRTSSSVHTV